MTNEVEDLSVPTCSPMSSHVKEAREQLERAHVLATEIQKQLGFTPASSPACAGGIERSVMEPAKAKSGAEEAQPRTAADPAPVPTEGAPSADDCPLFHEWRQLAGVSLDRAAAEPGAAPIGKGDALVIIDMQKDFVPSSVYNPDGGRFGVDEGDEIVAEICSMIRAASEAGATIIASRDYHPHGTVQWPDALRAHQCIAPVLHDVQGPNLSLSFSLSLFLSLSLSLSLSFRACVCACTDHCSFVHKGGHFPPHCVQVLSSIFA